MANRSFFNCFRHNCPETSAARPLSGSAHKYRKVCSDNHSLRRLVKAIFFHTLLVKKIRRKRSQNNSYASKHKKILSKVKQAPQIATDSQRNNFTENSIHSIHCSSLKSASSTASLTPFCSSSGISTISSTSLRRNEYFENKQAKLPSIRNMLIGKNQDINFFLFFFLVCLFTLTCLGKVGAIFCTSTLFVLVPSRVKRVKWHGRVGSQHMNLKNSIK